jgi:hypothetical protein
VGNGEVSGNAHVLDDAGFDVLDVQRVVLQVAAKNGVFSVDRRTVRAHENDVLGVKEGHQLVELAGIVEADKLVFHGFDGRHVGLDIRPGVRSGRGIGCGDRPLAAGQAKAEP